MTTKVTYFDAKVNNTEDYGTHVNLEVGIKMEDEQSAQFTLTVTRDGCQIRRECE